MDLYIQIGVLLLFLTALALFIYVYTTPATMFSQGISEKNAEVADRIEAIKDQDVKEALYNPNLSGSKALNLIHNSQAKGIAVIVQTVNQQGLAVNYGHQLRSPSLDSLNMKPAGASKGANANSFESRFVTTACALFNSANGVAFNATISKNNAFCNNGGFSAESFLMGTVNVSSTYPIGSLMYYGGSAGTSVTPHLMFAQANVTMPEALKKNETTGATGFLYTDNVLYKNQGTNTNFSLLENKNSIYYINKGTNFYSTLIKDANEEIIGVYLEEHGVRDMGNFLKSSMKIDGVLN